VNALTARPSNLERRVLCPGSEREESKVPQPPSSEAAQRGTRIHAHFEELVKAGAKKRPGVIKAKENGDDESRLAVQAWRDLSAVGLEFFGPDDEVSYHSEKELPLDMHGFDRPAHLDVAVIGKKRGLIADLKSGVWPYSPTSWQMKSYALAAWEAWQLEGFLLVILQPESDQPIRKEYVDASTLAQWAEDVEKALDACRNPLAAVVPDPEVQCKFCAAKGSCPAYTSNGLKKVEPALETLDLRNLSLPEFVRLVTAEQRAELLQASERMSAWLDELNAQLEAAATEGLPVVGYELRSYKVDKVWKDEAQAIPVLLELAQAAGKDQAAVRQPLKWLTPAQALKLFPKETARLEALIALKPSKLQLSKVKGAKP